MTREEAIEILEANRPDPCYQMLREAVDFAVEALKAQLPSAQQKQDREFMKLTFRNSNGRPYFSIIYLEFDDNGIGQDVEGYSSYSLDVISDYLKKYFMPSAQPERTCVNCGRTVNNGGWYADGRTRCPIEEHYALPKDGYCHLWEKRNVTDDNYPERREE